MRDHDGTRPSGCEQPRPGRSRRAEQVVSEWARATFAFLTRELIHLNDVPASIGEAGFLCHTSRCRICGTVEIDRNRAAFPDVTRGLCHESLREPFATMGRVGANGNLVAEIVMFLQPNAGSIGAIVCPGSQHSAVEWSQPVWQARV